MGSLLGPGESLNPAGLNLALIGQNLKPEQCLAHRHQFPCPECERQATEHRKKQERMQNSLFEKIRVGRRYHGMTFADYRPVCPDAEVVKASCMAYVSSFPDRLRNGDNLLLLGRPGTGKNMLAAIICSEVAKMGYSVLHTTALRLVRKIRESWGKDSGITEQQAIEQFSRQDVLVIDEVGVQYGTKGEEVLLFESMQDRYEAQKPTIIISNLDVAGITQYLGERIMDRLNEGDSACLEFTWDSWRRGNR